MILRSDKRRAYIFIVGGFLIQGLLIFSLQLFTVFLPEQTESIPFQNMMTQESSFSESIFQNNSITSDYIKDYLNTLEPGNMSQLSVPEFKSINLDSHPLFSPTSDIASIKIPISPQKSSLKLFGVETHYRHLVIAFDISLSVVKRARKRGIPFSQIREKTCQLINDSNPNTLIGLIQFSRKMDLYSESLQVMTKGNKRKMIQWMESQFVTNGMSKSHWINESPNGIEMVLKAAFALAPDQIIIISDCSFQRDDPYKHNHTVKVKELERILDDLIKSVKSPPFIDLITIGANPKTIESFRSIFRTFNGQISSL